MAIINLRDYYPFYTSDCFMEVSDEVAEMFKEFDRKEAAYSCYWKDQQGMVFVQFNILLQDGISNILPTISTLPEGFRPKDSAYGCAVLSSGVAIGLSVSIYGEIRLEDVSSVNLTGQYLKGTLAFISS